MPLQAVRPKILGFISEQASAWLVALVVFLAGCTLTLIVAWASFDLYQQQVRQRFQLLVNERYTRLQERFEDQEQRLNSLRRFFVNSDDVSREEFDGFAQPLRLAMKAIVCAPRSRPIESSAASCRSNAPCLKAMAIHTKSSSPSAPGRRSTTTMPSSQARHMARSCSHCA